MGCRQSTIRLMLVSLFTLLPGGMVLAGSVESTSAEAAFHRAYYYENEERDYATAAKLYAEVLSARSAGADIRARAQQRLMVCREELACDDFTRLMPPEALVYVELSRPGDHINVLLASLGLAPSTAPGAVHNKISISPVLVRELLGIRGAAFALTGIDPAAGKPTGVGVLHHGDLEVVRALIESGLPIAAERSEPIGKFPVYNLEQEVLVCLTARLVIISPQRELIEEVVQRLERQRKDSLSANPGLAEILQDRESIMAFFYADASRIVPMIAQQAGHEPEFQQVRAILDLDSLKWAAGRIGVKEQGIFVDLAVAHEQGHHNLAYNLIRTPPISKRALSQVPKGAAAFLAGSLSDPSTSIIPATSREEQRNVAVTGLDLGREIFANMLDFVVFALPPEAADQSRAGPVPDIAAVIRVHDARKSEALWTQILGIVSLAAGAPTIEGHVQQIAGLQARTFALPEGMTMYFATESDKVVLSSSPVAMARALQASKSGNSILDDEAFASSLARIDQHTSKAIYLHPGRCFKLATPFMHPSEVREAQPFVHELMNDLVISVLTHESDQELHFSAMVTGLPNMSRFLTKMIEMERGHGGHSDHAAGTQHRHPDHHGGTH